MFLQANNQSIIYDIEKDEETILPDLPNGVRACNPYDGTSTLLPLHPPDYTPEILICGGSNQSDFAPLDQLTTQDPTSDQCSRLTVTPEGIKRGWQVERMLESRILNEMVLMPNGQVLIINGAQTGYGGYDAVPIAPGVNSFSNADHPAYVKYSFSSLEYQCDVFARLYRLTPSLYTPDAPLGKRISNTGMPASEIPRLYHSSVTLTPQGLILFSLSTNLGLTTFFQ